MTYLDLIQEVGSEYIVNLYLQGKISKLDLAHEIGNSKMDVVLWYQKQNNKLN